MRLVRGDLSTVGPGPETPDKIGSSRAGPGMPWSSAKSCSVSRYEMLGDPVQLELGVPEFPFCARRHAIAHATTRAYLQRRLESLSKNSCGQVDQAQAPARPTSGLCSTWLTTKGSRGAAQRHFQWFGDFRAPTVMHPGNPGVREDRPLFSGPSRDAPGKPGKTGIGSRPPSLFGFGPQP